MSDLIFDFDIFAAAVPVVHRAPFGVSANDANGRECLLANIRVYSRHSRTLKFPENGLCGQDSIFESWNL
jgi:hypothetical protein